jgi:glycine cleavage system aminomethyltransferase T
MELADIKSMEELWEKGFQAASYEGSKKMNAIVVSNMNKLGDQGWELVFSNKETGFIFKRLK